MAVTEAIMQLFVKEMVSLDRVTSTVRRFATFSENKKEDPSDQVENEKKSKKNGYFCTNIFKRFRRRH